MAEYTMEDIFEDVTITLDGTKFRLRQRTKALGDKVDGLQEGLEKVRSNEDATETDVVVATLELLDAMLEPLGNGSENGTRTHAKTVLKKAWESDRIGSERLIGLLNFCMEKQMAALDPTSAMTTDA